jgi:hypothetical protein
MSLGLIVMLSGIFRSGCAENHFDEEMADKVMRGSIKMLADQGWDGVKFDSCSMFHNLTKWAALINETNRPVLIENCFQGAYTPGMRQWQGYIKNTSAALSAAPTSYSHYLGMFFGMESATPLFNISFADCKAHCDELKTGCGGFTFESDQPEPSALIRTCYVKEKAQKNRMDMSNAHCTGDKDPSDCPFNLYVSLYTQFHNE